MSPLIGNLSVFPSLDRVGWKVKIAAVFPLKKIQRESGAKHKVTSTLPSYIGISFGNTFSDLHDKATSLEFSEFSPPLKAFWP